MLDLYVNIKKLRKEKGWNQEELSERMGYSGKSMISKIERGEVDLTQSRIKQFSEVLGVTPDELMGLGATSVDDTTQLIITDKTEIQLVENYRIAPLPTQSAINLLLDIKEDDE